MYNRIRFMDEKQKYNVLRAVYGQDTWRVVKAVRRGWNTTKIATQYKISQGRVMAIKANYTRGTYDPVF